MRIAIASGKGGAGKTTIAVSLASVWNRPCVLADTDVEAPNVHLFLEPEITDRYPVTLEVPVPDAERCSSCGACVALCRFKAIARFGQKIVVFPEMCHGCGGCFAVCPKNALGRGERLLGELEAGIVLRGKHSFLMGRARVGESMTPPQLRALQARLETLAGNDRDVLLDAPPGVTCPAMTAVRDADLILLAAEPTPFGFHDFRLAHQAFLILEKPMAVVVNRAGIPGNSNGDNALREYCAKAGLPVLAELPFDRDAAEQYAKGLLLTELSTVWNDRFVALREALTAFPLRRSEERSDA